MCWEKSRRGSKFVKILEIFWMINKTIIKFGFRIMSISSDVVIHLGDTLAWGSGAIFFVLRILPHFELICDLLLKKRTATCRICLLSSSREAGQLQCSEPKKTADISRHHHWFPHEMTSEDMSASAIITPLYWSILCMWCMCNVLTSAQNCPKKAKSSWLTKPLSTKTSPLATAVPPGVILFFFCLIKKLII